MSKTTSQETECELDITSAGIAQFANGSWRQIEDKLAVEEPLEIRVRGRAVSVTMRTPGHDSELAAGFLLTEGIVRKALDIQAIEPCRRDEKGNTVNVQLAPDIHVDFKNLTRHVFATSSCGLCGKATIDSIVSGFSSIAMDDGRSLAGDALLAMVKKMADEQRNFSQTGGLHAAGLFDCEGRLLVLREDVGRHNAVDKIIGHGLLSNTLPFNDRVLLVSGRTSFEILQKSLAARIPIVASVSAPSSLAVAFARSSGQTLVGFLRDARFNLYSAPHRIEGFQE